VLRIGACRLLDYKHVGQGASGERKAMDLEEALAKVVELGREELSIVRKRAEERTPARDSGHDYNEMRRAADELDHHAHILRRLHDGEFGDHWRQASRSD
jgi:plasmid stabilization system protein ParE